MSKKQNKLAPMHNPPHPGEVLWELCIEPLGITITESAKKLGISRVALSEIINGRRNVTPQMAKRFEKAFKMKAYIWLGMQKKYDLWQTEHGDLSYLDDVEEFTGYDPDNYDETRHTSVR